MGARGWILMAASLAGMAGVLAAASEPPAGGPMPARTSAGDFAKRRAERMAAAAPLPAVPEIEAAGANPVDRFLAAWRRAGNVPEAGAARCDDATFVRRVYLDLIGVIPTSAELNRFLDDARPDKRERLIDELLARDGDYADHWTPFWEDALVSSPVPTNGGMATHGNYTGFIREAFKSNKPFDLFASELIDPTLAGFKPPEVGSDNGTARRVHYVLNEKHTDTLQTAAGVAQVFMGTAMKCASCHDHFENLEWPQDRFLAFAGLFAGKDLERIRCEKRSERFVAAAFPFAIEGLAGEAPKTADERLHFAAQRLTDPGNPRFARAIVNRLWKRYMGLGLYEPIDDFREETAVSCPDLLDWLAGDLVRSGHDLKHTIRVILTSKAYQARHEPTMADSFDLSKPDEARWFRSPTLRRLTAEQVIDSVRVAMMQRLDPSARAYRQIASTSLSRVLGKPAMRNDVSTGRSEEPAILQALEMLNGEEYQGMTRSGRLAARAAGAADAQGATRAVFEAVLSRAPSDDELRTVGEYLGEAWSRPGPAPVPHVVIWIDDELPAGSTQEGEWVWAEGDSPKAYSGKRSHTQGGKTEPKAQHLVRFGATKPVGASDILVAHVYFDAAHPPKEIMLQWNDASGPDGGWGHRAYWGEDAIGFGVNGTESRRRMGDLPMAGKWVELEIPAAEVGLAGGAGVAAVSFDQAGGVVHWDSVGVVSVPATPASEALADVLWALFTSPEFQFVR